MSNRRFIQQTVLSAQASPIEGAWVDLGHAAFSAVSVAISNIGTGDVVQVYGCNLVTPPVGAPVVGDGSLKIGADVSADGFVAVATPMRWIRARKSAGSANVVNVQLFFQY